MRRRDVLRACGIVGLSVAGGCVGENPAAPETTTDEGSTNERSSTQDTPTETFDPEIKTEQPALKLFATETDPAQVVYADEFTILATVANVGQEPLEPTSPASTPQLELAYTETGSRFRQERQRASQTVALPSGGVSTIALGPFEAAAAGTWTMDLENFVFYVRDGVESEIAVQPETVSLGGTVTYLDDAILTIEQVHIRNAFHYEYDLFEWNRPRAIGVEVAPDGQRFVVAEIQIANIRNVNLEIDAGPSPDLRESQFTIEPASDNTPPGPLDHGTIRLPGAPFENLTIRPGETQSVWTLELIDTERLDELQVRFNTVSHSGAPEAIVDDIDVAHPAFELVDVIAPETWQGRTEQVGAVVKNVGSAPGTFRGIVQFNRYDSDELLDPQPGKELTGFVDPGETVELTTEYVRPAGMQFRLLPFGETFQV